MPKFVATEASMYNGISQQSPELRLPSQVTDALNTSLTVPRGIERRPPAEFIAEFAGEYSTDSLFHAIPFSSDTVYFMLVAGSGSTIIHKVYDQEGVEYPIIYESGTQAYLETVDANSDFIPMDAIQLTTILDFTFVCNKNVTPAMSSTLEPTVPVRGYLWVNNGVQQVERKITVDGVTHTVGKSTNNDTSEVIDDFDTDVNAQAGYAATKVSESVLRIEPDDDLTFPFVATDTYADTTMKAALSDGCKFEDLPPSAVDGQIMTIAPVDNTEAEYFLQYSENTKIWSEVSAPGESANFDATTMPHAFIRKVDDGGGSVTGTPNQIYFNLETIPYVNRTSGGDESSPVPSFIGKKITDTFFFKNRLGFIAGDNVILSATDDLFRFWPTTVKEVLDDDPVDTALSSTRSIELSHVAPFPDSLIIIGDDEQFSLGSGGKAFTPENAVLDPTTTYSASKRVPPVTVGSTMYFIAPQSSFSALREYSVQPDTLVTDAADVTGHVPQLIPNNIKQMIAEPNLEYLFLVNTDDYNEDGNEMFVYKFFWQGNDKIQSAWQRWNFWFNPIGGSTFDGVLYLIGTEVISGVKRTVLTSINLSDSPPVILDDGDAPYKTTRPNIDRQTLIPNTNVVQGVDTITIEVTQSQYEYFDIEDANPILVDRISGVVYVFISRFIEGGDYFLTFEIPISPTDLGDLECLVLGGYTIGGCEPFN